MTNYLCLIIILAIIYLVRSEKLCRKKDKWEEKTEGGWIKFADEAEYIKYIKERPEIEIWGEGLSKEEILSHVCKALREEGRWFSALTFWLQTKWEGRPCIWLYTIDRYVTLIKCNISDKESFRKRIREGDEKTLALLENLKRNYPLRYRYNKKHIKELQ